jgi:hypothetical protein
MPFLAYTILTNPSLLILHMTAIYWDLKLISLPIEPIKAPQCSTETPYLKPTTILWTRLSSLRLSLVLLSGKRAMQFTWLPKLLFLEQTILDIVSLLISQIYNDTLLKYVNHLNFLLLQILMVSLNKLPQFNSFLKVVLNMSSKILLVLVL